MTPINPSISTEPTREEIAAFVARFANRNPVFEKGVYKSDVALALALLVRLTAQPAEPLPWDDVPREKALARWVLQDHAGLDERTAKLVRTFAFALGTKLREAERKYGYTDEWATADWEQECQRQLLLHVVKGDPVDVAAYAAFCWQRRWSTASSPEPQPQPTPPEAPGHTDLMVAGGRDGGK